VEPCSRRERQPRTVPGALAACNSQRRFCSQCVLACLCSQTGCKLLVSDCFCLPRCTFVSSVLMQSWRIDDGARWSAAVLLCPMKGSACSMSKLQLFRQNDCCLLQGERQRAALFRDRMTALVQFENSLHGFTSWFVLFAGVRDVQLFSARGQCRAHYRDLRELVQKGVVLCCHNFSVACVVL
jgi:hypothetical protein